MLSDINRWMKGDMGSFVLCIFFLVPFFCLMYIDKMPGKKAKRKTAKKENEPVENQGFLNMGQGFNSESICDIKKCLDIAMSIGDTETEKRACFLLLSSYRDLNQHSESLFYGKKCLKLCQKSGDKVAEMTASFIMGKIYFKEKNFDEAVVYGQRGLKCAKDIGDTRYQSMIYLLLQDCFLSLKKYKEAISAGQRCLEVSKAIGDTFGESFSLQLSGETYRLLNQSEDASNCFIKASDAAAQSDNASSKAAINFNIGKSFFKSCEYDKAIEYFKTSIEIAEESGFDTTHMHMALADSYLEIGEKHFALTHAMKCLKSSKRIEDKHAEMDAYALLGYILELMDRHENALLNINKAIAIMDETGLKDHEHELYFRQGKLSKGLKKYTDAIESFQKCANVARKTENKQFEKDCYFEIANSYEFINQFDRAVVYGRKLMRIAKDSGDVDDVLEAHLSLGIALRELDQYEDAHSHLLAGKKMSESHKNIHYAEKFQELLDMFSKRIGLKEEAIDYKKVANNVYESKEFQFACCDLDMKHLHEYNDSMKQGDYKEAITNLKKHLKEFDNHWYYHGNARVHCLLEIALLHNKVNQYEEALKSCQEGLSIAKQLGSKDLQAKCKYMEGDLYLMHLGKISKAINSYQEAIRYFDLMFESFEADSQEFKISLFEMHANCHSALIDALLCRRHLKKALMACDHRRARALKDLFRMYNMDVNSKLVQEDKLQFSDIKDLVSRGAFSILSYTYHGCPMCDKVYNFLIDKKKELQFIIVSGKKNSCESIQHHIYRAFQEIHLMRPNTRCENRSTSAHPEEAESNAEAGSSNSQVDKTLVPLEAKTRQPPGDRNLLNGTTEDTHCHCKLTGLKMLHHLLISRPMCSDNGGKAKPRTKPCQPSQEELVIIPDGPLYNVPFAALQDPDTGEYLSETKRIRIAPSIATLKLLMERPDDFECKTGALIIGDPEVGKVIYDGKERQFSILYMAYVEALEIHRIFHDQILLRKNATKAAVLELLKEGVSVVHIAAHGDATKATIALAPSPEVRASKIPEEEDYMLTMADVQKSKVRAKLVVLSCCHSGQGEIKAEGMVGMCRAFLASGARAVVASQWAIDDDATLEFMKVFYRNLKEKKSASVGLQLAMKFMRRTEQYHEPKYWAPFFLMGDDVVIDVN